MTAYQADWVCPASSPPIRNGCLVVENGRVVSVQSNSVTPARDHVHYAGCAIIPGFVNTHVHLELTLFQGLLEDLSFSEWISRLVRMKYQKCTRDALKVSAQLGAMELLRAGVTTIGEVMDIPTGWEAMLEFGIQGIAYQEVFGPADSGAADALRVLQEKIEANRIHETETQRIGISPHAPYSVSRTLYRGAQEYARRAGLRMTAHIAESSAETDFVRDGAGPFAESLRKRDILIVAHGCSPISYLHGLGLLGSDMLLVHAIGADSSDLDQIRSTGTCVAHCPKSNAYLGHRVAPIRAMHDRNIGVSLGTDSLASNDAFDMFAEMRMVVAQQQLGFGDVFRMATLEGARALGMERHVGSLEPGKRADFAVVPLTDPREDPLENMVRYAVPSDIRAVFLGGREVAVDVDRARAELRRLVTLTELR